MPDVLVDTDVCIDHLRGAAALRPGKHRLHYSVITRAELFAGSSATTLEHGLSLATRNRRRYQPVQGLRLRALR